MKSTDIDEILNAEVYSRQVFGDDHEEKRISLVITETKIEIFSAKALYRVMSKFDIVIGDSSICVDTSILSGVDVGSFIKRLSNVFYRMSSYVNVVDYARSMGLEPYKRETILEFEFITFIRRFFTLSLSRKEMSEFILYDGVSIGVFRSADHSVDVVLNTKEKT